MFKRLGKWLVRFFAFTGFMTFLSSLAMMAFIASFKPEAPELPETGLLHLDFSIPLRPMPVNDPITALFEPDATDLFTLTETIRRAATDDRIKGLVADISFASLKLAEIQELHEALDTFEKAGKPTYAFADTFGEGGNATGQYYLASGFQQIWMQPSGTLGLIGLGVEMPFFRNTLNWAGITPDFIKHGDYKTSPNTFTEDSFTPEHRQQIQGLLSGLYRDIDSGMKQQRPALQASLKQYADEGPYLAADALEAKLVDTLGYWDELEKKARTTFDKNASKDDTWIDYAAYRQALKKQQGGILAKARDAREKNGESSEPDTVALVYVNGAIMRSADTPAGPQSEGVVAASDIALALEDIRSNDSIGAVVLRINSPGGSYTASDTIRRAVEQTRASGKKVFVSMGTVAASGGYFIALAGDSIYANPSTITGSIGVYGGKFVLDDLADSLKVNTDSVQIGQNALMWSFMQPFEGSGRDAFENSLDYVFDDFRLQVSKSRDLPMEAVNELAGGRVFTGSEAVANRLANETGSLRSAIVAAKKSMNIDADALTPVAVYPRVESASDILESLLSGGGLRAQLSVWSALLEYNMKQMLAPQSSQLRMMPLEVVY